MEALSNPVISDYRKQEVGDLLTEVSAYLQNTGVHEDEIGVSYCKLGELYFLNGSINFDSLIVDILPEPAKHDGFLSTANGETLLINTGATTLTAPSLGIKTISGMYAIEEN